MFRKGDCCYHQGCFSCYWHAFQKCSVLKSSTRCPSLNRKFCSTAMCINMYSWGSEILKNDFHIYGCLSKNIYWTMCTGGNHSWFATKAHMALKTVLRRAYRFPGCMWAVTTSLQSIPSMMQWKEFGGLWLCSFLKSWGKYMALENVWKTECVHECACANVPKWGQREGGDVAFPLKILHFMLFCGYYFW